MVVSQGGHGTVTRSLINALPRLILPMGRDQADNAARVEAKGAGLRLPPTASQAEISAAVNRLITEPQYSSCKRLMTCPRITSLSFFASGEARMSYPLASTDSLAAEHGSRKKLATVRVAVNLSNGGQFFSLDLSICNTARSRLWRPCSARPRSPHSANMAGMGDAIMKLADKLLPSN